MTCETDAGPPVRAPDHVRRMMLLTDASSGSGLGFGATYHAYWRSVIGWARATGPNIGHASVPGRATTPEGTRIAIDVTDAARRWQADPLSHLGILLRAPSLDCVFHSRHAAADVRPLLHVLADGAEARVPCVADTALSPTTSMTLGGADAFKVGGRGLAAMRFATIPRQLVIISARVVLTVKRNSSRSAEPIYAAELLPPLEMEPPTLRDLWDEEGSYFRSRAIGFDASPEDPRERNLRDQATHPPAWKQVTWLEEDGEPFLRIHWNPGKRSGSFKIPVFHPRSGAEGRSVAFQYSVRVGENFSEACRESGKFPGFCSSGRGSAGKSRWPGEPDGRSGTIVAGNGGGNVHGDDGWSARGGYLRGIFGDGHPAQGQVPLHTYSYHLSQQVGDRVELWHEAFRRYEEANGLRGRGYTVKGSLKGFLNEGEYLSGGVTRTGKGLKWDYGAPSGLLVPGRWHRVAQVMRINDPERHDGCIHAFVDGRQVGRIEGMRWRLTRAPRIANSTLGIGAVWFNFYHGGIQYPRAETTIDVKRVVVRVVEWDE